MRPLVVVRPEPGASATAAAAREIGLDVITLPLFAIEQVEWTAPDPAKFDALLLTSANAVRQAGAGLDKLRSLPAHCVGEATAAAARDAGLDVASVGAAGVDSLLASLEPMDLLHLTGTERRVPVSAAQRIEPIAVYRAAELPPPDSLNEIEEAVVAVHSPRAAARLSELTGQEGLRRHTTAIVAMSPEAAQAAGDRWQSVTAAAQPTDSALLAIAARLCNNRG
jgi:uroporphyrinogen-III synthase